jgi:hypothetical protein
MLRFALYRMWLRLTGADSVHAVLKNSYKLINKLEQARDFHRVNVHIQSEMIKAAEKRRDESDAEALKADGVASRLRALLGS